MEGSSEIDSEEKLVIEESMELDEWGSITESGNLDSIEVQNPRKN